MHGVTKQILWQGRAGARVGRVIPNAPLRLSRLGAPRSTGGLGITRPTFL